MALSIAPVNDPASPAQTATAIIEALGLRADGPAPTGGPTLPPGVASLAEQRKRWPEQAGERSDDRADPADRQPQPPYP
jgi:hypothetical protein